MLLLLRFSRKASWLPCTTCEGQRQDEPWEVCGEVLLGVCVCSHQVTIRICHSSCCLSIASFLCIVPQFRLCMLNLNWNIAPLSLPYSCGILDGRFDAILHYLEAAISGGHVAATYIRKIDLALYARHAVPLPKLGKVTSNPSHNPCEQANSGLLAIREFSPLKLLVELWYYLQAKFAQWRAQWAAQPSLEGPKVRVTTMDVGHGRGRGLFLSCGRCKFQ